TVGATDADGGRLGRKDSNPRSRDQNPLPYHLATPHGGFKSRWGSRDDRRRLAPLPDRGHDAGVFFRPASWQLALIIFCITASFTIAGFARGRYLREHSGTLKEPFGVLQGALLGIVGLLLAFSLSLAVGRYQGRRDAATNEANAISTSYLRAQLLSEPERTESLDLLRRYTDLALAVSHEIPNSDRMRRTTAAQLVLQRRLWQLAGRSVAAAPVATAPRLYAESLNSSF